MKQILKLAIAALIAAPTLSTANVIELKRKIVLPVVAIDGSSFEVIEGSGAGPADLWCSAGIYARKVLGRDTGQLWVQNPIGPATTVPGRKAIAFSVDPVAPESTTYTFSLKTVGVTKSIAAANGACDNFEILVEIEANGRRYRR